MRKRSKVSESDGPIKRVQQVQWKWQPAGQLLGFGKNQSINGREKNVPVACKRFSPQKPSLPQRNSCGARTFRLKCFKVFEENKNLEIQLLNSWRQKFKIQISSASCSPTRRHNSRANFKFKNFMAPSSGKTFQLSLTGAKIETFNSQKLTFQFFFFF